jgi:hypothetical protein
MFHFRRAAFLTQIKAKVGSTLAKAGTLRICFFSKAGFYQVDVGTVLCAVVVQCLDRGVRGGMVEGVGVWYLYEIALWLHAGNILRNTFRNH